jgi:predicted methyltransferase
MQKFYLTPDNLHTIISALEKGETFVKISPDLNLSFCEFTLHKNRVTLSGKSFSLEELKKIAPKFNKIILIESGEVQKLEFFSRRYYKLKPTSFAPTVEIDGIQMHRTQGLDPWEDARRKASYAVKSGDTVLDTCGGLGYTAIWALKLGAVKVISAEKDENVACLRKLNPHSAEFFCHKIEDLKGDIFDLIKNFADEEFDSILHDPPRFSLAGELYSLEFYRELYRTLKSNGGLFHYVGHPFSKGRGRDLLSGIICRLEEVGFKTYPKSQDLGIFAHK